MEHKKIVITGASSGIGELLARRLAYKCTELVLVGRNQKKIDELVTSLNLGGVKASGISFDLANPISQPFLSMLDNTSILINSAADFGPVKNLLSVTEEEILLSFRVNVLAPIALTQAVLPGMMNQGYGRIMNIGSTGGLGGYSLRSPYCLSKSALLSFTKTLNSEILSGEYGHFEDIKAFYVCPGPVKGERLEKQIVSRAQYKGVSIDTMRQKFEAILNGKVLDPDEVVEKIISLLMPGITEQELITF